MGVKLVFIDTEFTDFLEPELISIGLVSEDGLHEFYAELPIQYNKCSEFVLEHVLPQLTHSAKHLCSNDNLETKLHAWINEIRADEDIQICFDFEGDWKLFLKAWRQKVPGWLTSRNIYSHLDESLLDAYFESTKLLKHHALNDARANRAVFLSKT